MKIEDLVVINKGELEKRLDVLEELEAFHLRTPREHRYKDWDEQLTAYQEERRNIKFILSNSKPLKGFVEDAFNESRRQHSWAGGHIYGLSEENEEEDLTDFKFYNKEDYLKQEIKW